MRSSAPESVAAVHVFMQAIMGGQSSEGTGVAVMESCTFVNNTGGCLQAVFVHRLCKRELFSNMTRLAMHEHVILASGSLFSACV